MALVDNVKQFVQDIEYVKSATSYAGGENGYLRWETEEAGKRCDTSAYASERMSYVLRAEAQFLKDNQKAILNKAVELMEAELEEVKKALVE